MSTATLTLALAAGLGLAARRKTRRHTIGSHNGAGQPGKMSAEC